MFKKDANNESRRETDARPSVIGSTRGYIVGTMHMYLATDAMHGSDAILLPPFPD